jgi:hypothetical protein
MNQTKNIWPHEKQKKTKNGWPHEDAFGLLVATHAPKRMRPHVNTKKNAWPHEKDAFGLQGV